MTKRPGSAFLLTQQSMGGGDEYGKPGHLSIFTLLKHLITMLLKCKFVMAS